VVNASGPRGGSQHGLLAFGEEEACLLAFTWRWSKKSRGRFHPCGADRGWPWRASKRGITQWNGQPHLPEGDSVAADHQLLTGTAVKFLGRTVPRLSKLHKRRDGHGIAVFDAL